MQRLSAPTRKDLNKAHRAYQWLDIATPSFRNLGYIDHWRTAAWLMLAISSLPLHLLYNSAVFTEIRAYDYLVLAVDESFTQGAFVDTSDYPLRDDNLNGLFHWFQNRTSSLTRMDVPSCINAYSQEFQTTRGDVIVIVDDHGLGENNSYRGHWPYETSTS